MANFPHRSLTGSDLVPKTTETSDALEQIIGSGSFPRYPYSRFVEGVWAEAKERNQATGALFELLVAACIYDSGVQIFYRHARLNGCPTVESDLLIWSAFDSSPWCIQLTSTLRERYKLADLQAFRVKSAYPKAIFALLTMDQTDTSRRTSGDFESLDELVYCGSPAFDTLIQRMVHSGSETCRELVELKKTQAVNYRP